MPMEGRAGRACASATTVTLVTIVRLSLRIRRFARDSLTASVTVPRERTAKGLRARITRRLALALAADGVSPM